MILLSARDSEAFIDKVLHPPEPSPTLCKAVQRYKSLSSR
jgi:uncharacterized protein (DUF1778 family)